MKKGTKYIEKLSDKVDKKMIKNIRLLGKGKICRCEYEKRQQKIVDEYVKKKNKYNNRLAATGRGA